MFWLSFRLYTNKDIVARESDRCGTETDVPSSINFCRLRSSKSSEHSKEKKGDTVLTTHTPPSIVDTKVGRGWKH